MPRPSNAAAPCPPCPRPSQGRQRKRRNDLDVPWHLESRQALSAETPELAVRARPAARQHHEDDDLFAPLAVYRTHHRGRGHGRMSQQNVLDFSWRDVLSCPDNQVLFPVGVGFVAEIQCRLVGQFLPSGLGRQNLPICLEQPVPSLNSPASRSVRCAVAPDTRGPGVEDQTRCTKRIAGTAAQRYSTLGIETVRAHDLSARQGKLALRPRCIRH
jgi:hypothetical protein